MKTKLLYILLLLFCSFAANAQKLTFDSFDLDPNALTARTNQVLDANGQPCALVKVGLVVPNAEFSGYTVKVVPKTSEYWVYMIDDAREIKISAPGFLPFEYNFPEPLKKNCTYRLVLNVPQSVTIGKVEMANLKITTDPVGAKVLINGQEEIPQQNGFYRLPKGVLDYSVSANMYQEQSGTLNFEKDGQEFHVKLSPKCGSVWIESSPSGAAININGKDYGTAPMTIDKLQIGEYSLTLIDGSYVYKGNFTIRENEVTKVAAKLEHKNVLLDLSSNGLRYDADVRLNGSIRMHNPYKMELPPGRYNLSIKQKGYKKYKDSFELYENRVYHANLVHSVYYDQRMALGGFAGYNYSSTAPFGLYFGATYDYPLTRTEVKFAVGWYVDFNLNLESCDKTPKSPDEWGNVDVSTLTHKGKGRLAAHAGPVLNLAPILFYAGVGWGRYNSVWQSKSGNDYYETYNLKGVELQGGIMVNLGPVNLRAGYTKMINKEKFSEINLGIGCFLDVNDYF